MVSTPNPHRPGDALPFDPVRPRKPWVAALMSLALPGWGQLYNGEANRAIWCLLVFALLLLPGTAALALLVPPVAMAPALALGVLAGLGGWLGAAVDAWRGATRRGAHVPRPWQTGGLYTLVFVVCALAVLPALTVWMRGHLAQPFRIPSGSMAPALLPGDFVFAEMAYNCPGCSPVQRGDVAVFLDPNDRTRWYVKRIVALPGDRVALRAHQLLVNGMPLTQPDGTEAWQGRRWQVQGMQAVADTPAELLVPPGHVWVLGDQRAASADSRQFGPVPLADVAGRMRQIWFSHAEGAVRWGRIGQLVH